MSKCLVTGGAGFIGSHLAEALLTAGHDVRVLDDFSTGKRENLRSFIGKLQVIEGSITDPARVTDAVHGCDWVFHLAALPSVQRSVEEPIPTHEACATGTLRVLDAARRAGVRRVVYAASSSAYGSLPGRVRSEADPLAPMSPYAAAKLAGEHYCESFTVAYKLETVRMRFFNIFGPRQDPTSAYAGVIARFAEVMTAGRQPTIYGDGTQSRDFTYVANAVQAVMKAAETPGASGKVYNVGTGGSTSLRELVDCLNQVLGTKLQPIFAPPRSGDVWQSQANITRAQTELGYQPTISFLEGLRRTVAATKSQASASR